MRRLTIEQPMVEPITIDDDDDDTLKPTDSFYMELVNKNQPPLDAWQKYMVYLQYAHARMNVCI